jgi:DNA-binding NtrC family response regulator
MTDSWRARFTFDDVRGGSDALARVIWIGRRAAEGGYPTLIVGESGTGTELLAHWRISAAGWDGSSSSAASPRRWSSGWD